MSASRKLEKLNNDSKNKSVETNTINKSDPKLLRLFAGGASAFVATAITCPLDVIKTRQQSSLQFAAQTTSLVNSHVLGSVKRSYTSSSVATHSTFFQQMMYMWRYEGVRSLFKGLAPSLIGAVSSRALFFGTYEHCKQKLKSSTSSSVNHVVSATAGGLVCTTLTCPLWVIKLRQQLHKKYNKTPLTMVQCCKNTWAKEGVRGFFRGLVVSYATIGELIVYFSIYEKIKSAYLKNVRGRCQVESWDLPSLMMISAFSRCISCAVCYPAEVARVRVRQELIQKRYCNTWRTLLDVGRNEGMRGLYGGLSTQLVRQALNMGILMGVYEAIMYQYKQS